MDAWIKNESILVGKGDRGKTRLCGHKFYVGHHERMEQYLWAQKGRSRIVKKGWDSPLDEYQMEDRRDALYPQRPTGL